MKSIGFSHFVSTSPNHLALVTPDGRHWSRAELLEESRRQARHPAHRLPAVPVNSAEYLARQLADQGSSGDAKATRRPGDQQNYRNAARHPRLPLGINPDRDDTLYVGTSLDEPGACAWALIALQHGCPLIITNHWELAHFLRAVQQYQVTGCYLSAAQMAEITSSSHALLDQYELSSVREFLADGKTIPAPPNWPDTDSTGEN